MTERTLKNIIGGLIGLALLYGIVALTAGGGDDAAAHARLADTLRGLDGEAVDLVRIERAAGTVTLRRADGGWTVDGRPADSAAVARLWTALADAADAEIASTNPDNHGRLGIDDASATAVAFIAGADTLARLLVGDAGPYSPSAYVRPAGGDTVSLARGELRTLVRRGADEWRDRTIVRVDTAAVRGIRVQREDGAYTLERGDTAWTVDGRAADERAVRGMLGRLAGLDASGFAPEGTAVEPGRTVTALGAGGDTLAHLRLDPPDDDERGASFRVSVPGRDAVFELPRWQADRLAPEPTQLRAEADGGG